MTANVINISASSKGDAYYNILQNKVNGYIEAGRAKAAQVLVTIEKESAQLNDMIVPIGTDSKGQTAIRFRSNGVLKIGVKSQEYSMHPHAVTQCALKLGVPSAYVRKLATGDEWERKLAANILNNHQANAPRSRALIRSVDNEVRGILSDSYKRISSPLIYSGFLDKIKDSGAIVSGAHIDHTRSWIEAVMPQIISVTTPNNGDVHMVFGVRISNSDFGDGALDIRSFFLQAVCLNGLVSESVHRQIHLGRKMPEDIRPSRNTYRLESETQASAVKDITSFVLSRDEIERKIETIRSSSAKEINVDDEVKRLSKLGLTLEETELSVKLLLNSDPDDGIFGKPTRWTLSQAVSGVARALEPRRKREVEEIAGGLMTG